MRHDVTQGATDSAEDILLQRTLVLNSLPQGIYLQYLCGCTIGVAAALLSCVTRAFIFIFSLL